jgi:hypothetical protein
MILFDPEQQKEHDLSAIVNKWCPKGAEDESVVHRLLRGLAHANVCVEDLRRVLRGESPHRPLESYPH